MKSASLLFVIATLWGALWAQGPATGSRNAVQVFGYDARAPLDFRANSSEDLHGITVLDVSYASPKGGRVPAFLVVPSGKGPFAGVVFVHWGQGDRTEFLADAVMLAHAAEVDSKRIGYVGHSLGATWGGPLAASDKRIRALVLMGGLPTITDFSGNDYISTMVHKAYTPEQIANYVKVISPIDPERFVGQSAPAALFFQFARHDRYITPRFAREYFDAAAQPKQEKFYFCSHEFNDPAALMDRDQFLQKQLGLSPVMPIILRQMGIRLAPARVVGKTR